MSDTVAAPKPRRRWIGWAVALGAVVLLVVAYVVAEGAARTYATGRIHTELAKAFDLDADHPMEIDLGSGSLLLQAARGSIDSMDVTIADVPLGDIAGTVRLAATGIPLDQKTPVQAVTASATVDAANVEKLAGYLTDIDLDSITLSDGVINASATVKALIFDVAVSVAIAPSVSDGQLVFAPQSVTVNGANLSLDDLRDGPFGSIAARLTPSQSFCVAQYLPASIELTGVSVTGGALVIDFAGSDVLLSGDALSTKGSCA